MTVCASIKKGQHEYKRHMSALPIAGYFVDTEGHFATFSPVWLRPPSNMHVAAKVPPPFLQPLPPQYNTRTQAGIQRLSLSPRSSNILRKWEISCLLSVSHRQTLFWLTFLGACSKQIGCLKSGSCIWIYKPDLRSSLGICTVSAGTAVHLE